MIPALAGLRTALRHWRFIGLGALTLGAGVLWLRLEIAQARLADERRKTADLEQALAVQARALEAAAASRAAVDRLARQVDGLGRSTTAIIQETSRAADAAMPISAADQRLLDWMRDRGSAAGLFAADDPSGAAVLPSPAAAATPTLRPKPRPDGPPDHRR